MLEGGELDERSRFGVRQEFADASECPRFRGTPSVDVGFHFTHRLHGPFGSTLESLLERYCSVVSGRRGEAVNDDGVDAERACGE